MRTCRGCRGPPPGKILKNQEYRRSHLWPFCTAIKVLRLPEFSLFVDVSEKKLTIFMLEYRGVYVMVNTNISVHDCVHVNILHL